MGRLVGHLLWDSAYGDYARDCAMGLSVGWGVGVVGGGKCTRARLLMFCILLRTIGMYTHL